MSPALVYMPTKIVMLTKMTTYNILYRLYSPFFRQYPPRTDARFINRRPILSDKYKYLYLHVPKAASSSVTSNLYFGEYNEWPKSKQPTAFRESTNFRNIKEDKWNKIRNNYFIFGFARNPYTRIASAYLDKVAEPQRERTEADWRRRRRLARYFGRRMRDEISFDMFLDYLEFGKGVHGDPHWAPQSALLGLPVTDVEFVGALETIDVDLPYVLQRIFDKTLPIKKIAPHATDGGRFAAALPAGERRRIYRLYEADFESFGYARDDVAGPPARRRGTPLNGVAPAERHPA